MYPRIRALREDHDLSQRQVAEMLGMSQTAFCGVQWPLVRWPAATKRR